MAWDDDRIAITFADEFHKFHSTGCYLPGMRDKVAETIAKAVNAHVPRDDSPKAQYFKARTELLNRQGYVQIGQVLDRQKVTEVVDYFSDKESYGSHVANPGRPRVGLASSREARAGNFASYTPKITMQAPHLLEIVTSPAILQLAEAFLGCTPTLYHMHTFWSFPQAQIGIAQDFHRDLESHRIFVLFGLLTDVGPGTGMHRYVRGSHRPGLTAEMLAGKPVDAEFFFANPTGYGYTQAIERYLSEYVDDVQGPAGTFFAEDAFGLHSGTLPVDGPRFAFWARLGPYADTTIAHERIPRAELGTRVADDERTRFVLRKLVKY